MSRPGLTRRQLLRGAAAATCAIGLRRFAYARAERRRPNILLVVTDQERSWVDLPPGLGLHAHETLLAAGRGFRRYHVHTTPCSPSRSTIYCGQHTQHTGITANLGAPPFPALSPSTPTLGHLLREAGYRTAYKGKWHLSEVGGASQLGYGPFPTTRDALEPFGFSDYNADGDPHGITWTGYKYDRQTASEAARWLATRGRALSDERTPWLLAVNFVNPHDVMYVETAAAQTASRLDPRFLAPLAPPPAESPYDADWTHVPLPPSWGRDDLRTKPWAQRSYVEFCNMVYGTIAPDDEAAWRRYQSYYFNCIRDADQHLATVLAALDQAGLAGETIVVFTADHGEMAGAHGLRQKGPFAYAENVRVPLVIRHPDVGGGGETDALAGAVDLVPTLLAFAGVEREALGARHPALHGVDLSAVVADSRARTPRDERGILFDYGVLMYADPEFVRALIGGGHGAGARGLAQASWQVGRLGPSRYNPALFRGIHDGRRWKFVRYFRPAEHHRPTDWTTLVAHNELELYDLAADPGEIVNLAAEPERHRDVILALNARLNALVDDEVGPDDGAEHPGPTWLYRLGA